MTFKDYVLYVLRIKRTAAYGTYSKTQWKGRSNQRTYATLCTDYSEPLSLIWFCKCILSIKRIYSDGNFINCLNALLSASTKHIEIFWCNFLFSILKVLIIEIHMNWINCLYFKSVLSLWLLRGGLSTCRLLYRLLLPSISQIFHNLWYDTGRFEVWQSSRIGGSELPFHIFVATITCVYENFFRVWIHIQAPIIFAVNDPFRFLHRKKDALESNAIASEWEMSAVTHWIILPILVALLAMAIVENDWCIRSALWHIPAFGRAFHSDVFVPREHEKLIQLWPKMVFGTRIKSNRLAYSVPQCVET